MLPSHVVEVMPQEQEAPLEMGEIPPTKKVSAVCHCLSLCRLYSQLSGLFIMLVVVERIVMSRQLLMFTGFKMRLISRWRRQRQMSRDIEIFM